MTDKLKFYIKAEFPEVAQTLSEELGFQLQEKTSEHYRFNMLIRSPLRNSFYVSNLSHCKETLFHQNGEQTWHSDVHKQLGYTPRTLIEYLDNFDITKTEYTKDIADTLALFFPFYMTLETQTKPETLFFASQNITAPEPDPHMKIEFYHINIDSSKFDRNSEKLSTEGLEEFIRDLLRRNR